ncbi:MAG: hypothetical protein A2806_03985 [Candidatus Terrybacteria bacterium RIFCSPHIGHO2_01_FULL_48_17]|uniref:Archease domain-containing protein n=1 Tax=Candidatus Terrybacteria bacterium RIFCSPHIGHO2_01_FULL_48_17 TaxID=1802362 RepID=A0A1G2PKI3_9BACT|nr:MAG: hypothetical protein A2806_03985 [Candidatus Terrybacteria bacterium RIFCSPHIGHO2_01_FULL_48_17]
MPYEILPHTADVRVKASGASLGELFREMMRGMFHAMKPRGTGNRGQGTVRHEIKLAASDGEALLADFLNEVLYLGETNQEAYEDAKFLKLSDTELQAELVGKKRESVAVQVKAATYHGLKIEEKEGRVEATVVFDI